MEKFRQKLVANANIKLLESDLKEWEDSIQKTPVTEMIDGKKLIEESKTKLDDKIEEMDQVILKAVKAHELEYQEIVTRYLKHKEFELKSVLR